MRLVLASTHSYCVVLLTNFTFMDLPAGKMHYPPERTCLVTQDEAPVAGQVAMLLEGVSSPKTCKQVLASPDADQWLQSIQEELEARVGVTGALLMMSEEDMPVGCKLGMPLVLRPKMDTHMQLQKRKSRNFAKGNTQESGVDCHDTFVPCTQLSSESVVIGAEDLYVRLPQGLEYGGYSCAKLLKDAGLTVFILAYVDDYVITTDGKECYGAFVTAFHSKYACEDLDVLDLVMGIGVLDLVMGIDVR
ncbi:hypothetical protein CYMTET_46984 [Cymbomonas tetramitiformis]|uniref:Uncharacterized protein n=1 Tax=Cymbomonas tetramitiformis TaxID=36881 RepID=A0AAE0BX40_9CHLO|nr:hypothetical protein CYMTET_46984 [Cymbomonas tetramitiformis]